MNLQDCCNCTRHRCHCLPWWGITIFSQCFHAACICILRCHDCVKNICDMLSLSLPCPGGVHLSVPDSLVSHSKQHLVCNSDTHPHTHLLYTPHADAYSDTEGCVLLVHNNAFTDRHTHTLTVSLHIVLSSLCLSLCLAPSHTQTHTHTHKDYNQVKSLQLTGTQEVRWIHTLIHLPHMLSHTHTYTAVTHSHYTPYTLSQVFITHTNVHVFPHAAGRTCCKASAFLFVYKPITWNQEETLSFLTAHWSAEWNCWTRIQPTI